MSQALPPSSGGSRCTCLYEELRGQVLSGNSRGPGLAVLLSGGMKAWLEVAGALDVHPIPPGPEIAVDAGQLRTVPGECRNQLTAVLAGMVLHSWPQWRSA